MKISHVLLPTDFSECSETALEYAKSMAKQNNAKLSILFVIDQISKAQGWYVPNTSLDEFYKEMEDNAKKRLERCCYEDLRDFKDVQKVVVKGMPADEIVKYANESGVDMIVMGTFNKAGMDFLFGSTVEKVMRKVNCPVLCVKAPVC